MVALPMLDPHEMIEFLWRKNIIKVTDAEIELLGR